MERNDNEKNIEEIPGTKLAEKIYESLRWKLW